MEILLRFYFIAFLILGVVIICLLCSINDKVEKIITRRIK